MMTIDDSQLRKLFKDLSPAARAKVFRSTMQGASSRVKKMALAELRSTTLKSQNHEKEIYREISRDGLGFKVSLLGGKGERQASSIGHKPILMWAEGGTARRHTRTRWRRRKGHTTWRMPRYGFLERALHQAQQDLPGEIKKIAEKKLLKIAEQNGFGIS